MLKHNENLHPQADSITRYSKGIWSRYEFNFHEKNIDDIRTDAMYFFKHHGESIE